MLKKILLVLAALVAVFLVVVAFQPSEYRVTRSAAISAPPAVVYSQVNDFRKWDAWSPWAKIDPNMQVTHSGAAAGTGASYHWTGNSDVGEGRMTITDSRPAEQVNIKLEFIKPFASTADTAFTFKPAGAGTEVTWSMAGQNNFIGKAMCMFMNMDKMVGGDFEKGLAAMKSVAESAAKK